MTVRRIGVFGWGVIAPKSPDIERFAANLACAKTWLEPFNGFGPDNFLVGVPESQFDEYQSWIDARFPPRHFRNLKEKMDFPAQFALGAFIQALGQNPGIEEELRALREKAHVYIGTGLGALGTIHDASIKLHESQQYWDRFWAAPERNSELRAYISDPERDGDGVPPSPDSAAASGSRSAESAAAERTWNRYWMERSPELAEYLTDLAEIDGLDIEGEIEAGKIAAMREKERRRMKLQQKWQAPEPPWKVTANIIWNIPNTPAAQVSILGKITGPSLAPCAACSTFGVTLRLAMQSIRSGDARLVVVGATDGPPHQLTVGAFYSARVLSSDRKLSTPLTRFQGTHVAGGSVVWIVGDLDYMTEKGYKPLGMEPLTVGVTSDADHIITPSSAGPTAAIRRALEDAGALAEQVGTWDLHATATPGDYSEMSLLRSIFPDSVLVTARKGTFGHGMSAGGGWELTAQYLGYERGKLFPTPLHPDELHSSIAGLHKRFVYDAACEFPPSLGGKLSMGIGGVNACIISRPW